MHKLVNGKRVELTTEEINEIKTRERLEEEYNLKYGYSDKRKAEYPTTDELIVALWEQIVEGDNSTIKNLQLRRQAVKQKYPKGGTS